MTDDQHPHDPAASAADRHIDAVARAAGSALRRPARDDGVAGVRRAGRRRQAARVGAAGAVLAAVTVVGVVALRGGDRRSTVVPATEDSSVSTDSAAPTTAGADTEDTVSTSVPPPTPQPPATPPDSLIPPTTDAGGEAVTTSVPPGAPPVVYGSDTAIAFDGSIETQHDPLTGAVLTSGPMDAEASLAAQQATYGGADWPVRILDTAESERPGTLDTELALGRVTLRLATLPREVPTIDDQDPAALPFFDRCQQSELIVSGPAATAASALPDRALAVSATGDGRYLVVLRAECPVSGTLDEGVVGDGYEVVAEAYDLGALDEPGRELMRRPAEECGCTLAGTSPDGRYVAVREFASALRFRVFDLESAAEVEVASGCDQGFTTFAGQYGPWVAGSILAVVTDCGDGPALLVVDASESTDSISIPAPVANLTSSELDVRVAGAGKPWYVLCGTDDLSTPSRCWVGQAGATPVELPGVSEASFLPLGFRAGG